MQIIDIVIETIPPLNILPNGARNPHEREWCFGGTVYHVTTTEGPLQVQVETLPDDTNVFYEASYSIHSTSLLEVLTKCCNLEEKISHHLSTTQSSEHHAPFYLNDREADEIL
jgi:hypothetical protein